MSTGSIFKRHDKLASKGLVVEVCCNLKKEENSVSEIEYEGYVSDTRGVVLGSVSTQPTFYETLFESVEKVEKLLQKCGGSITAVEDELIGGAKVNGDS